MIWNEIAVNNINTNKDQEKSGWFSESAFPTNIPEMDKGRVRKRAALSQTLICCILWVMEI
jgi:hypothetical protein